MNARASGFTASRTRDIALLLVTGVATLVLPFNAILVLFIVTGQAHFLMSYVYQYRGGKMDHRYLFAALFVFLGSCAYFALNGSLLPLVITIGVLFSAHFAYDEVTLHGESHTVGKLITVAGFTIFFSVLVLGFAVPSYAPYGAYAIGIPVLALLARFATEKTPPGKSEIYLWLVEALIFGIAIGFGQPERVLGTIVLLHVADWYVGYGARVAADSARAKRYWTEVGILLAILSLLCAVYIQLHVEWLGFLFKSTFYYAWAIAHIVLSFVASLPRMKVGTLAV